VLLKIKEMIVGRKSEKNKKEKEKAGKGGDQASEGSSGDVESGEQSRELRNEKDESAGTESVSAKRGHGRNPVSAHPGAKKVRCRCGVLVQFFEGRQTEPISPSPYAARTASHTCRIMAHGPVISDVLNCPFLILFANSIPLKVTSAFPNVLNPSIG
jgi:hypothetical protein